MESTFNHEIILYWKWNGGTIWNNNLYSISCMPVSHAPCQSYPINKCIPINMGRRFDGVFFRWTHVPRNFPPIRAYRSRIKLPDVYWEGLNDYLGERKKYFVHISSQKLLFSGRFTDIILIKHILFPKFYSYVLSPSRIQKYIRLMKIHLIFLVRKKNMIQNRLQYSVVKN